MTLDLDETKGEVYNNNSRCICVHLGHRLVVLADVALEKISDAVYVRGIDISSIIVSEVLRDFATGLPL